ncbi:hypothetical protein AB2L37_01150 [Staphylococcus pseudintermedius]|uniref:hypothetical protein n=1 Tax=Staphylococcus pseudintermedius TaxID=283734 RepID=UPI003F97E926
MSRHVVAFHSSNTYESLGAILFDSYEDAVVKLEENGYQLSDVEDYYTNVADEKHAVIKQCVVNRRYLTSISKDNIECFAVYVRADEDDKEGFLQAYISDEIGMKKLVNDLYSIDDSDNLIYRYEVIR